MLLPCLTRYHCLFCKLSRHNESCRTITIVPDGIYREESHMFHDYKYTGYFRVFLFYQSLHLLINLIKYNLEATYNSNIMFD